MPKQYLAMKRKFKSQGMDDDAAKTKAAKIYNSKHPGAPVTKGYDAKRSRKRKRKVKYPEPK